MVDCSSQCTEKKKKHKTNKLKCLTKGILKLRLKIEKKKK